MNNIAVLFAGNLSSCAHTPVGASKTAYERALATAGTLPGVGKVVVLGNGDTPRGEGWEVVSKPKWNTATLLAALEECSGGCDDIFFYHADCPLIDIDLACGMYDDHREFFAEYTFADGYPLGLTVEILQKKILGALIRLAGDDENTVARDTVFSVIQRDINTFDIETKISPVDLRLLRVSLTCDTKRNTLLVERVVEAGGVDHTSIIPILQNSAEILRTLPAYVSIQSTDRYPQKVSYLPDGYYPAAGREEGKEIPPDKIIPVVEKLSDFAGDLTLGLSYRGEPAMHSRITELVCGILDVPGTRILIETSGTHWPKGAIGDILSCDTGRITWIVELDARDRDLYRRLRGAGYDAACSTAEELLAATPETTYLQAVRMRENEEDLEKFYRYWKEKTEHVIIKKYDYFSGRLSQEKVTDLSPLKRFPCWHIKRDLYILTDGRVPMCGEDIACERVLGNVFTESIEDIWNGGVDIYAAHLSGEYPSLCAECDEYYTFNF